MAEVTVAILNYNGREILERCIKAVVDQKKDGLEVRIVLLDNNSTDESWKLLGKFGTVMHLDNHHRFITGLNAFIDLPGDIKLFVENDVYLGRSAVSSMLRELDDKRIVQPVLCDMTGKIVHAGMRLVWPGYGVSEKKVCENPDVFATTCFMVHNATLKRIGYFDTKLAPAYYEDVDYSIRARSNGVKPVVSRTIAYHQANFSFSKVMKKREISDLCSRNRKYVIRKHFRGTDGWLRLNTVRLLDATVRPHFYDHN